MAPTTAPCARAYTGARNRADFGLKIAMIALTKPTIMAIIAQLGNEIASFTPMVSTELQP